MAVTITVPVEEKSNEYVELSELVRSQEILLEKVSERPDQVLEPVHMYETIRIPVPVRISIFPPDYNQQKSCCNQETCNIFLKNVVMVLAILTVVGTWMSPIIYLGVTAARYSAIESTYFDVARSYAYCSNEIKDLDCAGNRTFFPCNSSSDCPINTVCCYSSETCFLTNVREKYSLVYYYDFSVTLEISNAETPLKNFTVSEKMVYPDVLRFRTAHAKNISLYEYDGDLHLDVPNTEKYTNAIIMIVVIPFFVCLCMAGALSNGR